MNKVECVGYVPKSVKVKRVLWNVIFAILFRPFPTMAFWRWRWLLLRCFGAKVSMYGHVYASAKIWAPWNLVIEEGGCLGPDTICYNQAEVSIGKNAIVSQYAYLCTAGHDVDRRICAEEGLQIAPIRIEDNTWIGTRAFVGMGVTIGEGAVVGATASVYKDVEPWTVVGGNPAKVIKKRNRFDDGKNCV